MMRQDKGPSFSLYKKEPSESRKLRRLCLIAVALIIPILLYVFSEKILTTIGAFLIENDDPLYSDAIVVLHTGVDYYPRLMEAAHLYRKGFAPRVVINGNRKSDTLREIEKEGFFPCCFWYEDTLRMLDVMGVPRDKVLIISAEDVYDTVSEAKAVGGILIEQAISTITLATSKFHSRRAAYIWRHIFKDKFKVRVAAARDDPYAPNGWWKEGRQIRWVLSEYGAWIYDFWKTLVEKA